MDGWMRLDIMNRVLLAFVCCAINASVALADWQSTLETNFTGTYSKVCTFDKYDDWVGTQTNDVSLASDMPEISGVQGIFSYYSFWSTYPAAQNWIDEFGTQSWTAGQANDATAHKSACIDIGTTKYGPSRLAVYFGNEGAAYPDQTGYQDVYVFYMVYFYPNNWPTANTDGVWTYTSPPYVGLAANSWKHQTINMGCEHDGSCEGLGTSANYSLYHVIDHFRTELCGNEPCWIIEPNDNGTRPTISSPSVTLLDQISLPGWIGIETRYNNYDNGGTNTTRFDVWFYLPDGTATQIHSNKTSTFASQPLTDLWNNFEWGGNCSGCTFGSGMQSYYFVDDLVIHNSRIGPTYFSLLNAVTTPNVSGVTISGASLH